MSQISRVRIKRRLSEKLRQHDFRRRFFRARAQEEIAQQIRELRERRKLRQVDLANKAKMKQSAVSRIEQAGYSAWSYKTFLRVADALDAQLRVLFEASEDVIARYEKTESEIPDKAVNYTYSADASMDAWRKFLADAPLGKGTDDVLRVPHHGAGFAGTRERNTTLDVNEIDDRESVATFSKTPGTGLGQLLQWT